jgi:hypothetical protein
VGCARIAAGRSSSDVGLSRGARRTRRGLSRPRSDVGISHSSGSRGSPGSELGRATARTACRRTRRAVMGSSCTFSIAIRPGAAAVSSLLGSARRARSLVGRAFGPDRSASRTSSGSAGTVLGIARGVRTRQARSSGNFVESTGAVVGPAEARRTASASGVVCP